MQLRVERALRWQTQVVTDRVEHRAERAVPATLVDPHSRPGNLPGVANSPIEERLFPVAVLRGTGDESELSCLRSRYGQPQLAHTHDLDRQIVGRSGPTRGERPAAAQAPQQRGQVVARTGGHGREGSCGQGRLAPSGLRGDAFRPGNHLMSTHCWAIVEIEEASW